MVCRRLGLLVTLSGLLPSQGVRAAPGLPGLFPLMAVSACHAPSADMGTVSFEPFTLPFNGTGQVDIVEGGTVCVGLKETSDEDEAPLWYVLTSSGGDLVCVESGLETWLTTAREAPAVVKSAGAGALVRRVPDRFAGCPSVVAAWSGSVTLARASDGSFHLRALDTESGKVLHAQFRTAVQGVTPPQPMEEPQTSSCSVQCETGSCSVTCVGNKAECYCKDGRPYCYCGRKLSIVPLPPVPF
jgi:hypothetical protein